MKRRLILTALGLAPLTAIATKLPSYDNPLIANLIKRWQQSKTYTLAVLDAMPETDLEYTPSEFQMSFAQHFMHIGFINNSFIGVLMDPTPYAEFDAMKDADFFLERPDPVNLFQPDALAQRSPQENKAMVSNYLAATFDYVIASLEQLNDNQLSQGLTKVKPWYLAGHTNLDLILRGESHTAHHRAQAICYLRMKKVQPPGYSKHNTF